MSAIEFQPWPKTPRLFRDITITEKIDGTNAAVVVVEGRWVLEPRDFGAVASFNYEDTAYTVGAQSRKRLVFPGEDNFGFAGWVKENAVELAVALGDGIHYGEWWGKGIQRGYGQDSKNFSLFNTHRYADIMARSGGLVDHVPVLYQGPFSTNAVNFELMGLGQLGSKAAPGFLDPEGVVVYHSAAGQVFKVLLENDDIPKGLAA